jgi:hypothetical protein
MIQRQSSFGEMQPRQGSSSLYVWLIIKGRIQCGSNLHRKRIIDSPACSVCGAAQETPDHLFFQCPFAVQFWSGLGFQSVQNLQTSNLHCIRKLPSFPEDQYSAFISMCCWQLWKRRNRVVFRDEHQSIRNLLLSCKSEAIQWRARMPKGSKKVIEACSTLFDISANSSTNVT